MVGRKSVDALVSELDYALRSLWGPPQSGKGPGADGEQGQLDGEQAVESAALMRVNMAGELSAQGLYRGQALTAKSARVRQHMQQAADEERAHLDWCRQRIAELGGAPSLLNPLWYGSSVVLGALAGLAGDKWSLGFVAETERQVAEHLQGHLGRLSPEDRRSRAILQQMREDEQQHGQDAERAGAAELPPAATGMMRRIARVMTSVAYRL